MDRRQVWIIEKSQQFRWQFFDSHFGLLSEAKTRAKKASQSTGMDFRIRTQDHSITREIRGTKGGW